MSRRNQLKPKPCKPLDQHLAEKAARKADCAARDEDTPEKVEWFKQGIARRRAELGWTFSDE